MTKKIWKMCVVGLVIASPLVCTATTISDAVATADDGKYLQMDPGSSITLTFAAPCGQPDTGDTYNEDIVLYFTQESHELQIAFYYRGTQTASWTESNPQNLCNVIVFDYADLTFDKVVITASSGGTLYLDAVKGYESGSGVLVDGVYAPESATGTVTPFPDPKGMIELLIADVATINDAQGIVNSLDAKLNVAFDALDDANASNDASAVSKLEAFINEVEAQRGKKITDAQATALVTDAEAIIAALAVP
jgi:hypothetical protein